MGDHNSAKVTPGRLTLDELRAFAEGGRRLELDESCWPAVEAAAAVVERAARGGAPVYGINTGFGKLASVRIAPDQIEELQRRLVLSHMCGLGPPLPDPVVRLTLALKAASLALGHSGVRRRTIELLLALLEQRCPACDPGQGIGRRLGRPGAARPSRRQPDRRRRGAPGRRGHDGGGGARPHRRAATDACRQGGAGAPERHPGLDRAGAPRPVPGAGGVRCRPGRRRHERGCGARQRRAVRSAPQCGARPAGADPRRRSGCSPARRQRDPRLASGRVRARPGPLQPALPAAGDGRLPRAAGRRRRGARARGERRLGQPAGVR